MCKHYVVPYTGKLFQPVVVQYVANQVQCIPLYQPYMPVGVKTVGFLVEQGTVAIHQGIVVSELDMSYQELCIAVLGLVEIQYIRVQQVHSVVGMGAPDNAEQYQYGKQGLLQCYLTHPG